MRRRRGLVLALVALVAAVLALRVLDGVTRPPGGHSSSSYATAPDGDAAYASLLQARGHSITRLRGPLTSATPPAGSTLIVLDPGALDDATVASLRTFVSGGGRLLAGGFEEPDIDRLLGAPLTLSSASADRATPLVPVRDVAGVARIRTAGGGSISDAASALPVLARGRAVLVAVATIGRGRLVVLADTSPLSNDLLGSADDAALGLALAGPGRPVAFTESVHGYGQATGFAAIPTSWRVALVGLVFAAIVFMVACGRRLGPPERADRVLPPARREHVDAVAATLRRTGRPDEAAEPLRRALRTRLGERDVGAALGTARGEQGLIDAAAALAKLEAAAANRVPGRGSK